MTTLIGTVAGNQIYGWELFAWGWIAGMWTCTVMVAAGRALFRP